MRLACKLFSDLDGETSLVIETALPSKTAIDSLILFLSRRSAVGTPGVNLKLTGVAAAVMPSLLPSVLRCSCLQTLDLLSLLLQPLEAALSLALLPQGLLSLSIQCGTSIVMDSGWTRLTALTNLNLITRQLDLGHAQSIECIGLCSLPALTHLALLTVDRLSMGNKRLASLCHLAVAHDPFQDPPTRAMLPNLTEISFLSSRQGLPVWVEDWPLESLDILSWSALSDIRLPRLRCKCLTLAVSSAQHLSIDLASMLAVPALKQFRIVMPDMHQQPAEICLQGTEGQYRELLKRMSFQLGVPTFWKLMGQPGTEAASVSLQSNGHPFGCQCKACT